MALAIMNVGQYAKAPVRPSGDIVLTIQNQSTLGSTIEQFATNGSIILGITFNANSVFVSSDEGVTWSQVALTRNVIDVYYSETTSKFYLLESKASTNTLYYGESTDGTNWTWNALTTSTENDVRGHKVAENANGIVCYYLVKGQYTSEEVEDGTLTTIGIAPSGQSYYPSSTLHVKTRNGIFFRHADRNEVFVYNSNGYISSRYITYNQYQKSRMGKASYGTRGTSSGGMYPYELYVSDDFSTQVKYTTYLSSQIYEYPMGYFELNGVFYVFSQTRIAKGDNIQGIMDIFYTEAYDIADMANLREILHLEGQHILLSADGGKIYKCTLT